MWHLLNCLLGFSFFLHALTQTCNFIPGSLNQATASIDNNVMWDGLWSDQSDLFMEPIEPRSNESVIVKVRTLKNDIQSSNIVYYTDGSATKSWVSMAKTSCDVTDKFEYWSGTIPASLKARYYYFQVNDGPATAWYSACGPSSAEPVYTVGGGNTIFWYNPGYVKPGWVRGATFYQIFVDRFNNGDILNDKLNNSTRYSYPNWLALPETPPTGSDYFGGDLAGIQAKLGYLKNTIGINAIYLTPIFSASDNHRYDVNDYKSIAPELGGNVAFKNLTTAAHSAGVAIVLDMVLGHTGSDSIYFDKSSRYSTVGAYESTSSIYRDRYTFGPLYSCQYAAWWDHCTLPQLNFDSVSLQNEVYGPGNSSILQSWMMPPYHVDGLRFDVLTEVRGTQMSNKQVVNAFNMAMKAGNTSKLMIGELHWNSDTYMYYKNAAVSDTRGVDGEMRYNAFTVPVSKWVTGFTSSSPPKSSSLRTSEFNSWVHGTLANIPLSHSLTGWNSLGTHDTSRFLYRAGGDIRKLYLGIILQYTMVGTPMIYYGDEVGMTGAGDPDCRRTFNWDNSTWNLDVQNLYINMTTIYKERPALQSGSYQPLYVNDQLELLAFGRFMKSDRVVVIVNNSPVLQRLTVSVWYMSIPDGTILTDQLRGCVVTVTAGTVTVDVMGHWGVVLAQ